MKNHIYMIKMRKADRFSSLKFGALSFTTTWFSLIPSPFKCGRKKWITNFLKRLLRNMDDRTIDLIFAGSLESLPPVSSKIVRIFTSSTFTGIVIIVLCRKKITRLFQIPQWNGTLWWPNVIPKSKIIAEKNTD